MLNALWRFILQHGKATNFYSDNGTNFSWGWARLARKNKDLEPIADLRITPEKGDEIVLQPSGCDTYSWSLGKLDGSVCCVLLRGGHWSGVPESTPAEFRVVIWDPDPESKCCEKNGPGSESLFNICSSSSLRGRILKFENFRTRIRIQKFLDGSGVGVWKSDFGHLWSIYSWPMSGKMTEAQLRTFLFWKEPIVSSRPLTPIALEMKGKLTRTPQITFETKCFCRSACNNYQHEGWSPSSRMAILSDHCASGKEKVLKGVFSNDSFPAEMAWHEGKSRSRWRRVSSWQQLPSIAVAVR